MTDANPTNAPALDQPVGFSLSHIQALNSQLMREFAEAFAKVIDTKDEYTNGHSIRVAAYTRMLALQLGIEGPQIERMYNAALLHDIGKVCIPTELLLKNAPLTDKEYALVQSHPTRGYQILKDVVSMPEFAQAAGCHHERPDGKGYPRGLKGEEIPRIAQIIAAADSFDAMYSDRPYRPRMNFECAVDIVKNGRGNQFASDVVDAFLELVNKGLLRAKDDNGGGSFENIDNCYR